MPETAVTELPAKTLGLSRGREIAFGGVFGAAALVLPVLFHAVHLGPIFMPMYIPLVILPFFVGPLVSCVVAASIPLLSALLTGMPPLFPPVAPLMAVELAVMAVLLAVARMHRPATPTLVVLVPVLLLGRALHVGLVYLISLWLELPAAYVAGLSLLSGWPGILLMLLIVPPVARMNRIVGPGHGK